MFDPSSRGRREGASAPVHAVQRTIPPPVRFSVVRAHAANREGTCRGSHPTFNPLTPACTEGVGGTLVAGALGRCGGGAEGSGARDRRQRWTGRSARLARARVGLRMLLGLTDRGGWVAPGGLGCAYPRTGRSLAALSESGMRLVVNLHGRPHGPVRLEGTGSGRSTCPWRTSPRPPRNGWSAPWGRSSGRRRRARRRRSTAGVGWGARAR